MRSRRPFSIPRGSTRCSRRSSRPRGPPPDSRRVGVLVGADQGPPWCSSSSTAPRTTTSANRRSRDGPWETPGTSVDRCKRGFTAARRLSPARGSGRVASRRRRRRLRQLRRLQARARMQAAPRRQRGERRAEASPGVLQRRTLNPAVAVAIEPSAVAELAIATRSKRNCRVDEAQPFGHASVQMAYTARSGGARSSRAARRGCRRAPCPSRVDSCAYPRCAQRIDSSLDRGSMRRCRGSIDSSASGSAPVEARCCRSSARTARDTAAATPAAWITRAPREPRATPRGEQDLSAARRALVSHRRVSGRATHARSAMPSASTAGVVRPVKASLIERIEGWSR